MANFSYSSPPVLLGQHRDRWAYGDWTVHSQEYISLVQETGEIISTGNPQKNGLFTRGSNFYLRKAGKRYHLSPSRHHHRFGYNVPRYTGSLRPWREYIKGPVPWSYSKDAAYFYGAEAWKRARPAKPDFKAAENLLELRELPALFKLELEKNHLDRWNFLQGTGNSGRIHLYWNFGWLPLLRTIRDFVKTHRKEQKIVDQLFRDNGRPVRRKGEILDEETITAPSYVNKDPSAVNYPTFVSQCYVGGFGKFERVRTIETRKVWYSGKFRYYLPAGPRTVAYKKALIRGIYGLSITPSALYNAMPWSWLIDYFTNLGDIIENLSPTLADRLICDYMYVMHERTYRQFLDCRDFTYADADYVKKDPETRNQTAVEFYDIEKVRESANRFGFRVKVEDLSPTQYGILAALGLSKLF